MNLTKNQSPVSYCPGTGAKIITYGDIYIVIWDLETRCGCLNLDAKR